MITTSSTEFLTLSASRSYIDIRIGGDAIAAHPFALLSDHIEAEYERDPTFFDLPQDGNGAQFHRSVEYQTHPLVELCHGTDTQVFGISIYGDGIQVTEAPLEDSLYVVYIAFLHRDTSDMSLAMNKHVYTVYRKNDNTTATEMESSQITELAG